MPRDNFCLSIVAQLPLSFFLITSVISARRGSIRDVFAQTKRTRRMCKPPVTKVPQLKMADFASNVAFLLSLYIYLYFSLFVSSVCLSFPSVLLCFFLSLSLSLYVCLVCVIVSFHQSPSFHQRSSSRSPQNRSPSSPD